MSGAVAGGDRVTLADIGAALGGAIAGTAFADKDIPRHGEPYHHVGRAALMRHVLAGEFGLGEGAGTTNRRHQQKQRGAKNSHGRPWSIRTSRLDLEDGEINRGRPKERPRRLTGEVKSPGETPEKLAAEMNLEACRNLGPGVAAGGIELGLGEALHMGEVGAQK